MKEKNLFMWYKCYFNLFCDLLRTKFWQQKIAATTWLESRNVRLDSPNTLFWNLKQLLGIGDSSWVMEADCGAGRRALFCSSCSRWSISSSRRRSGWHKMTNNAWVFVLPPTGVTFLNTFTALSFSFIWSVKTSFHMPTYFYTRYFNFLVQQIVTQYSIRCQLNCNFWMAIELSRGCKVSF